MASSGSSSTASRGEAQLHGHRHEVLLGAVVQVALELAPLGVAGGDDACPRLAAAPGCAAAARRGWPAARSRAARCAAPAPTWRASSVSTRSSASVNASPSRRRVTDDEAEQLAGVGDRRHAHGARPPRCRRSPGSQTSSHVPPLTPARATTADSLAPITTVGASRCGHAGGQLVAALAARPHLGRRQDHRLAQDSASCSSSSSSGIDRVSRWPNVRSSSSGETRSPYTSRLARSVSRRRAGQVEQGGRRRRRASTAAAATARRRPACARAPTTTTT